MILPRRSASSCAAWAESDPLVFPKRSVESTEIIRGLLAVFAEHRQVGIFVAHNYPLLYNIPGVGVLSVGCPGQRALMPKGQLEGSANRMYLKHKALWAHATEKWRALA